MADIKISELTRVASLNNGDLVEVSQVNELAPSGYTSLSASMTDIGAKVNTGIEYTTDLADFSDKTIVGAINENKDNLDSLTSATLPYSTDPTEGTTKEKIEGLETSKANLITTEAKSTTFSVSANVDVNVDIDVTKQGYTPLGVLAYSIGNSNCFVNAIFINSATQIRVRVRSLATIALNNIALGITVLYIKNT